MPTLDELKATGYHGVLAYCSGCRTLSQVPWAKLPSDGSCELARLKARLRCIRCGTVPAPQDVGPFYNDRTNAIARLDPPQKP